MDLSGLVWQPMRLILAITRRIHRISIVFDLEPHGPDTYVGIGPRYPWGGLYGGQIVAQALRAAAATIEPELTAHSLRADFIRRGDHSEPIRYEVDRIRNGRSFAHPPGRRPPGDRRDPQPRGVIPADRAVGQRAERGDAGGADARCPRELVVDGALRSLFRARPRHRVRRPVPVRADDWLAQGERGSRRPGGPGRRPRPPLLAGLPVGRSGHRRRGPRATDGGPSRDSWRVATPPVSTTRCGSIASCGPIDGTSTTSRATRYVGSRGLAIGHVFADDGTHVATFARRGSSPRFQSIAPNRRAWRIASRCSRSDTSSTCAYSRSAPASNQRPSVSRASSAVPATPSARSSSGS